MHCPNCHTNFEGYYVVVVDGKNVLTFCSSSCFTAYYSKHGPNTVNRSFDSFIGGKCTCGCNLMNDELSVLVKGGDL